MAGHRGLSLDAVDDGGAAAVASDIPSLDRLLKDPALAALAAEHGPSRVTAALRTQLAALRRLLKVSPANTVAMRRRLAEATVAKQGYLFE